MFQPPVGYPIQIEGKIYSIAPHPAAASIPYGQEGRQSIVFKVTLTMDGYALKVFKPKYRQPSLVRVAENLSRYKDMPGLAACQRKVLSADKHLELLKIYPDLAYSMLMPWIEGPTWAEIIGSKQLLDPETSLALAQNFLKALVAMEEQGLAHGDLSGPNLLLPMLQGGEGIALVDLEQMYGPGMEKPELLTQSSPGYGLPCAPPDLWAAQMDRYPGSILLAELLCFCDEELVSEAWGESYFDPDEVGKDCRRFQLMAEVMGRRWGGRIESLFRSNWFAESIYECSDFSDWLINLPDDIGATPEEELASSSNTVKLHPSGADTEKVRDVKELEKKVAELRARGDHAGADEISLHVIAQEEKGQPPASDVLSGRDGSSQEHEASSPAAVVEKTPAPKAQQPPPPLTMTDTGGKRVFSMDDKRILAFGGAFLLLIAVVILILSLMLSDGKTTYVADEMFRADPQRTGYYAEEGVEKQKYVNWAVRTGGNVCSSPVLAGGMVYCGSDDWHLHAISVETGSEVWIFKTGGKVTSSTAVVKGVVYFGSNDKNIYALDARSGKEKWRFETEGLVQSSPAVIDGVVYCGSNDRCLYALNADTGVLIWKFETGEEVKCAPAVVDGVVYCGSYDKFFYALNADTGVLKWKFETGGNIYSSPAVVDGVVYFGCKDFYIRALDAEFGTEKWKYETKGEVYSSPAVVDGTVFVGSDDKCLYALDAGSGVELRKCETKDLVRSSPAVAEGMVYFGSRDGFIYALDVNDFREAKWEFKTGNFADSSPFVSDGVLYCGSWDDFIYALR